LKRNIVDAGAVSVFDSNLFYIKRQPSVVIKHLPQFTDRFSLREPNGTRRYAQYQCDKQITHVIPPTHNSQSQ
jgi:hypothetical protein